MPEVEVVQANRGRLRRAFLEFPYRLYAQDGVWVAPLRGDQKKILDERRHPFYRHAELQLFIARRGSSVLGRIAAIVDHNALPEACQRTGSFGFFESVDDQEAASGLIDAAKEWLRGRGMHLMRGPVYPSFNYGAGVLVEGFGDPPAIGTFYNPPYYDRLLAGAGMRKSRDLLTFSLKPEQLRNAKARAGRFGLTAPGARLRPFDVRQREREVKCIWELHSKGFATNYEFVPLSIDEVRAMALDIEHFGDERFVQFCEVDGRTVGVVIAFPDWNQALRLARGRLFPLGWWRIMRARRHINRIRIFMLGMAPESQGTGMAAAFLALVDQPDTEQYTDIEASWIEESHPTMMRAIALLGARVSKRYRVYETGLA
jgi:hypothetical protein